MVVAGVVRRELPRHLAQHVNHIGQLLRGPSQVFQPGRVKRHFLYAYPSRPHRTVLALDRGSFRLPLRFGTVVAVIVAYLRMDEGSLGAP